jgi:hypothetical protein
VTAPVAVEGVATEQVPGVTVKLACAKPGLLAAIEYAVQELPSVYVTTGDPTHPAVVSPQIAMVALQLPPVGPAHVHGEQARESVSELKSSVFLAYPAGHATSPL